MIIKQVSFEPGVSAWVFDQQAASAGDFLISQAAIDNFPGTWHIDIEGDSFGVSSIVLTSEGVNDTLSFLIFRVGQLVRLFANTRSIRTPAIIPGSVIAPIDS